MHTKQLVIISVKKRYILFQRLVFWIVAQVSPAHAMKAYRWRRGIAPLIHILAIRRWWPVSHPDRLISGKEPGTHWMTGWVGPSTNLEILENKKKHFFSLSGFEIRIGEPTVTERKIKKLLFKSCMKHKLSKRCFNTDERYLYISFI
jgi:hypothetical protein